MGVRSKDSLGTCSITSQALTRNLNMGSPVLDSSLTAWISHFISLNLHFLTQWGGCRLCALWRRLLCRLRWKQNGWARCPGPCQCATGTHVSDALPRQGKFGNMMTMLRTPFLQSDCVCLETEERGVGIEEVPGHGVEAISLK